MMKMTEKSLVKLSMMLQISISIHGKRFLKKEKIFAKVNNSILLTIFIELLEKNRHKRPTLQEVLNHGWFSDFADIHKMRA